MLQILYAVWMSFYLIYIIAIITHLCMREDLSRDNAGIFLFLSSLTLFFNIGVFGFPEIFGI